MSARATFASIALVGTLVVACDAITSIAVDGASFGGATADAYCDRRFVTDGGAPSAFCQEVTGTVAASQFADDCRNKHQATAGPGQCPRASILAGCFLLKKNDDGSLAWDWYYDVSPHADADADTDADADADGDADADANAHAGANANANANADADALFQPPVAHSVADVIAICADRTRYPDGAELALP